MSQTILSYREAREQIRSGDVLLFRREKKWLHYLIAKGTRGEHVHAAMACWWGPILFCVETIQETGGRAVALSSQIKIAPNCCDVFRVREELAPTLHPKVAIEMMLRNTGTRYGWKKLLSLAWRRLPLVRLFVKTPQREKEAQRWHCSGVVSEAMRSAGVDLVPNLASWATTPADLARSAAINYLFTIGEIETPAHERTSQ